MRRAAIVAVIAGLGLGVLAKASGLRPVKVTSGSMMPAIDPGEWVLEDDGRSDPRRGQIVMFRYPFGSTGRAVKRVAAVTGDTVSVTEDALTVNGRTTRLAGSPVPVAPRTLRVPAGHVFLLGDNSAGSLDSRRFGAVDQRELVGRVRGVIPLRAIALAAAAILAGALVSLLATRLRAMSAGGRCALRRYGAARRACAGRARRARSRS
jgi:signal peptidase I